MFFSGVTFISIPTRTLVRMIPDCSQWSYNYDDDRLGNVSGISIISYVDEERPIEPVPIILDESIVLSSIDYQGDTEIIELVNLNVNDEGKSTRLW